MDEEVVQQSTDVTEQHESVPEAGESGRQFAIQVEPNGRKHAVLYSDKNDAERQQQEMQREEPSGPQYKSAGELLNAMHSGQLEESRIPVSAAFEYEKFRQEQQEAIAREQERAYQAYQAQQQAIAEQQPQTTQIDVYKAIEDKAKECALQDAGLTEDELELAEYTDDEDLIAKSNAYKMAKQWHTNGIMRHMQEQEQIRLMENAQHNAVLNDVIAEVRNRMQSEPHAEEIFKDMDSAFMDMPYAEAVKYADCMRAVQNRSFTPQQAKNLQEYYDKARLNWYAKNNLKPRQRSPYVERAGSGESQGESPRYTINDLRNAKDYRQRREILSYIAPVILGRR